MITLGVLCLVFSLGLVLFIFLMKRKIDTTVSFLKVINQFTFFLLWFLAGYSIVPPFLIDKQLACSVLQSHTSLFLVSVVNSAFFLLLTLLWYWNFSWVYVMGHEETRNSGIFFSFPLFSHFSCSTFTSWKLLEVFWILNPSSYVVSTFLIFVYLWTASVVNYVQTFVISEVTCHWYYHRNDPSAPFKNPVTTAYRHALTTSFGSICFASLVYSFLRLAQILVRQATRVCDLVR